ncbi:hypothetical protein CEXT_613171 [Caerostris extrusa]|uniref:Uncharacterized protein n=1 Tax=Caerostris extrusa TaxID=172846 RepID=A0AAV4RP17_CAEEX|nr:hypothetical protein CEXT_613171 [Caerostris extrusa]
MNFFLKFGVSSKQKKVKIDTNIQNFNTDTLHNGDLNATTQPVAEKDLNATTQPVAEKDLNATTQPVAEKDLNATTQPVAEKDLNATTQPVVEKDLNAATQPAAKKDLKRMLLNEDDWAERVIPAARKDLSKMFEQPIHPDTSQSTNMSKHTEDFHLLEEGELDYEELESPSTTCSGSTDTKRPRRHAVIQQTPNDPRLLAVVIILECKTVLNPSSGKECIVSSL